MRSLAWSALDYGTGCTEIPSQTVLTREDAETAIREFVKAYPWFASMKEADHLHT